MGVLLGGKTAELSKGQAASGPDVGISFSLLHSYWQVGMIMLTLFHAQR